MPPQAQGAARARLLKAHDALHAAAQYVTPLGGGSLLVTVSNKDIVIIATDKKTGVLTKEDCTRLSLVSMTL